jgi:hypothetical protein
MTNFSQIFQIKILDLDDRQLDLVGCIVQVSLL